MTTATGRPRRLRRALTGLAAAGVLLGTGVGITGVASGASVAGASMAGARVAGAAGKAPKYAKADLTRCPGAVGRLGRVYVQNVTCKQAVANINETELRDAAAGKGTLCLPGWKSVDQDYKGVTVAWGHVLSSCLRPKNGKQQIYTFDAVAVSTD
ncbi:MAG TPA: hypothetical protein VHB02_05425 [Acidimicrobiales bacterium]|nr:hypothetical protein [Acidimicrobiales bacterium]